MKTTAIEFKNDEYSFNVLASSGSGAIIDTYVVGFEPNFNDGFEVYCYSIGVYKYKTIKTEEQANLYAMKWINKLKKQYEA